MCICNYKEYLKKKVSNCVYGRDGAPGATPPLPKIGKNMICWSKIVIFHTIEKYPKKIRASLRSAQILLSAPP